MRAIFVASVMLMLAACATERVITPREYLDETTAATITIVADPWIFNRKDAPPQLDFVHLYAIDVNRMGEHRKYLAVVKYWPAADLPSDARPKLVVQLPEREIALDPIEADGRELGIGEPIDKSAPRTARSWFYPLDKEHLEAVGRARELSVALLAGETRASYIVWRDGSAEMSEFAAVAQDL